MGQPAQQIGGTGGDQFYVTHCTTADSVLNNPGYTVRAASSEDRDALEAAFRYPPYELPIDMWRELPPVELTPRRLARTAHPDGGVWVVHSAYLAKDTVDRDRSYFSHLLLLPAADPAEVLQSWGADGWIKSYPQGPSGPKRLPGRARLPVGPLVNESSLTAFLSDNPPGPLELSTTVCPIRLRASAAERRNLFARVLQALLLLAEAEDKNRRRVYVHAEPGVVALLLYGAVRVLPQRVIDGLTFSTFEPHHRNIRDYKLAEVVGTYLGPPENGKGLDADLGTTRGIALDTVVPARSSPELRKPLAESLPTGVNDVIELVARGEWHLLPAVRHAMGGDPTGLPKAGKALIRARGMARVDSGEADIDELLAIQEDRLAAEELKTRVNVVWPVVKRGALDPRRADVRAAFRELLAESAHVKEMWEESVEAILKEDFRTWDARWTVLREVATAEAKKLLYKLVSSEKNETKLAKLPTDVRTRLRTACNEVDLVPSSPLLVPIGLGELEPLLSGPPDCAGFTAYMLMAREELNWLPHIPALHRVQMRERAREFLQSAPAPVLAAYLRYAGDTDPSFISALFVPFSPAAAQMMDKLLAANAPEPHDWIALIKALDLTNDAWGEYLLEKGRLGRLLAGLGGERIGEEVWGKYLDQLTSTLISPDLLAVAGDEDPIDIHQRERKVFALLRTAADRLTAAGLNLDTALPEGGKDRLEAATNLIKWTDNPALAESDGSDAVKGACAIFEIEPLSLIEAVYLSGFHELDPAAEPQEFAPLLALFKACFPVDHNFSSASRATKAIVQLSSRCHARSRGSLQVQLLHACVSDLHFREILNHPWKEPLKPATIAWLSEQANRPPKKRR